MNTVTGEQTLFINNIVDIIDIAGDVELDNGGRLEVGLSYILDWQGINDANTNLYPPDPSTIIALLFFIVEEDSEGGTLEHVVE